VILDKAELEKCVPHKGPMFILDRLVEEDLGACRLVAEVDIKPSARFYRPDQAGVPVWVGFEYMAQSIAALSGRAGKQRGEEPRIGFIMGVRDYVCQTGWFALGSVLRVEVVQEFRDGPVVSFRCRISSGGSELVTAVVNAIEADDSNVKQLLGEGANG
jgi:predicted hotdog family 3-hydroxylacyl-ACP dehydratase